MQLKEARKLFNWKKVRKPCWRCNGTGIFKPYGNCFRCRGSGFRGQMRVRVFVDGVSDEDKAKAIDLDEARLEQNRERAAARREAKREANVEAVCADIGVPVEWLNTFDNQFIHEMMLVAEKRGKLTTNQAAAVLKIYREQMQPKRVAANFIDVAPMDENGSRIVVGCPCCGHKRNVALNGWDAIVCGACDAVLEAVATGQTRSFIQHLRETENQSTEDKSAVVEDCSVVWVESKRGQGTAWRLDGLTLGGALLLQKEKIRAGATRAVVYDQNKSHVSTLQRSLVGDQ